MYFGMRLWCRTDRIWSSNFFYNVIREEKHFECECQSQM